jgi:hypothetical protein
VFLVRVGEDLLFGVLHKLDIIGIFLPYYFIFLLVARGSFDLKVLLIHQGIV